jgi:hypothetical protein
MCACAGWPVRRVRAASSQPACRRSGLGTAYTFAPKEEEATVAALTLGLGKSSRLLAGDELASVVGAFQSIADVMLADLEKLPSPVDQLDELR